MEIPSCTFLTCHRVVILSACSLVAIWGVIAESIVSRRKKEKEREDNGGESHKKTEKREREREREKEKERETSTETGRQTE